MPHTYNGIGTMFCGHAAAVRWGKPGLMGERADHDAVVCITIFFLPVFPLRAYHTYAWSGNLCKSVEIRRSGELLMRAMSRPYLLGMAGIGGFVSISFAFILLAETLQGSPPNPARMNSIYFALFFIGFLLGFLGLVWLRAKDFQQRDIRLILGRHELGSSDPATWTRETLESLKSSVRLFGANDPVAAGEVAMRGGRFGEAMLAARLGVAQGDARAEELTGNILRDMRVLALLDILRKEPWRRAELLPGDILPSLDPRVANRNEPEICFHCGKVVDMKTGTRFYDKHMYCGNCLDQAGGPGFSASVRQEPILIRMAPDFGLVRFVLLLLAALFSSVMVHEAITSSKPDKWEIVLGGLVVAGIFFFFLVAGSLREVALADGELRVGWRNKKKVPIEGIQALGYRRWIGLFPIVAVQSAAGEISWPRRGEQTAAIERALQAYLLLRFPGTLPCEPDHFAGGHAAGSSP